MLSSKPRTAQRTSSIASTVFDDSLERASVMVRLTAEKSLSDWTELVEMQRMRLATSANNGNSPSTNNIRPWCHLCRTRNWIHQVGPVLIVILDLFLCCKQFGKNGARRLARN